jgi:5-methylcytosine-specific restriction endonuclease McrA
MATRKSHQSRRSEAARRQAYERSIRRRAGFEPWANLPEAIRAGFRRELKRKLFAGRERAPCCFCERELTFAQATLEHIRPKSRGGSMAIENLALSCQLCNHLRGDMGYEKFRGMSWADHAGGADPFAPSAVEGRSHSRATSDGRVR